MGPQFTCPVCVDINALKTQALTLHMIAMKTRRVFTMSEATHVSVGPVSIISELTKRLVMDLVAEKIVMYVKV